MDYRNYETIKNNFQYDIGQNDNKIYYINNNVFNDPLLNYIKNIEHKGAYSGDLEIS